VEFFGVSDYIGSAVDTPICAPRIFDDPCIFTIDDVPADNFDCVLCRESWSFRIDLVQSVLVDQEISVDGNGSDNWAVVEDLEFDVFGLGRDTIVSDVNSLAFFQFFSTSLRGILRC
jgi:hypothetical protein